MVTDVSVGNLKLKIERYGRGGFYHAVLLWPHGPGKLYFTTNELNELIETLEELAGRLEELEDDSTS